MKCPTGRVLRFLEFLWEVGSHDRTKATKDDDEQREIFPSQQVIGYFEAFNREGKTIVMVTHDPRAADRATRTLRLTAGKIVAEEQSGGCVHVA
ncbi:MAG: hypothetical protein ACQESR_01895 [Planctomycetota bacterium]